MIFDSHCHLQFKAFNDNRAEVLKKCREKDTKMIVVGTQQDTSKNGVELAEKNQDIKATVGLHPIQSKQVKVEEEDASFVARGEDFDREFYENLITESDEVVGIGETGLDKHHIPEDQDVDKLMDEQWSAFLEHVKLAREYDLPVVMHIRKAHKEMLSRLEDIEVDFDGVVHCFTSKWEYAKQYLDYGFNIGFTGIITFPPKSSNPQAQHNLWETVEQVSLDRLLVETDAPFLAPQKYRGDTAEPWMTEEVIKKVAEIKNLDYEEVEQRTAENCQSLFNIS
jgi:TatD DNase family protein